MSPKIQGLQGNAQGSVASTVLTRLSSLVANFAALVGVVYNISHHGLRQFMLPHAGWAVAAKGFANQRATAAVYDHRLLFLFALLTGCCPCRQVLLPPHGVNEQASLRSHTGNQALQRPCPAWH